MDIDRRKDRKWRLSMDLSFVLIFNLLSLLLTATLTQCSTSTLYFTNNSNIDKLENKTITSVIEANSELEALDCNSCDNRIYWISNKTIKRGKPKQQDTIESVLDFGITNPKGVAVDWRGESVYFTDQLANGGSLEVVSCDGKFRRVLIRHSDEVNFKDAGPVDVDPLHGYVFFADVSCCIWRCNMDGSYPMRIIDTASDERIVDIAVDYNTSKLYWISNNTVHSSDYLGNERGKPVSHPHRPFGVSVSDGVLYWTEEKTAEFNGTIFSLKLHDDTSEAVTLSKSEALDPHDISAFVSQEVIDSANGGCSDNKGDCTHLCFTVPNSTHPLSISSNFTCACRTGFTLNGKTCVEAPNQFLLFGEGSYINILSFDLNDERIPLPLAVFGTGTVDYITYDRTKHLIYFTQRDPPAIWQSELDGENRKAIVTESISLPNGLVLSDDGNNLYWADSSIDKIEVMSLFPDSGFSRKTLIDTRLKHPLGVAINETTGYIYWTDLEGVVEQAAKDGSKREQIHYKTDSYFPGPIAINPSNGVLYWADSRSDYLYTWVHDWEEPKKGLFVKDQHVAGLTVLNNVLYWSDRTNGRLYMEEDIIADGLGQVRDVTAVNIDMLSIQNNCTTDNGGCEEICVTSSNNKGRQCLCRDHFKPDPNDKTKCIEEYSNTLILSINDSMVSFNIKDSNIDVSTKQNLPFGRAAKAMDINYRQRMLYWIGSNDGIIYRSNMQDNTTTAVITCCHDKISDIAVDWWGKNLYWTDTNQGIIWVSKLDGSNKQMLYRHVVRPTFIVVHPYKSKIYFVAEDSNVYSLQMNGANLKAIETSTEQPIFDLKLDLSLDGNILYWLSGNTVFWLRLDGSDGKHQISDGNLNSPNKLAILGKYVYISDRRLPSYISTFKQFDFDSSIPISALIPTAMVLNHYSVQPDVHWCTAPTNGECDPNSDPSPLCLVVDHYDRECRCPPTKFLQAQYDYNLDVCRYTCTGTDSFLLLATKSEILHLPLRDPDLIAAQQENGCMSNTPQPRELPLGDTGSIHSIAYDPVSHLVHWADQYSLRSMNVFGNYSKTLMKLGTSNISTVNVHSMGYDWRGGTLFWSEEYGSRISAVSSSSLLSGVVRSHQFNPKYFWQPISLAVDSSHGTLYWSNSSDFSINKINLRSLEDSSRVDINHSVPLQIKLLTVEPKTEQLFWYNSQTKKIEGFVKGNQLNEIASNDENHEITAMAATNINGTVCLFWYNKTDWSVYYYNTSSNLIRIYYQFGKYTNIISMAAHSDKGFRFIVPENNTCLSSNCSHFCSLTDNKYQCTCPQYRTVHVNDTECSELECPGNMMMCDDESNCYSNESICDGVRDCDDGSDEKYCDCKIGQVECGGAFVCLPVTDQCNGDICSNELCGRLCNDSALFTCTVNSNERCVPKEVCAICTGKEEIELCKNDGHSPTVTSTMNILVSSTSIHPSITSEPDASTSEIIVSILSVLGAIALVISLGMCAIMLHCFLTKRRKSIDIRHEGFSGKSDSSPRPSSPIRSICTSDVSLTTVATISTNVDKMSQEARLMKRHSTLSTTDPSNPPNSPISGHRSIAFTTVDDDITLYSAMDPPIPPPPNPSLNYNYDAISEGISSVSQRRYPGVIPSTSNRIFRIDEHPSKSPPPPYLEHETVDSIYEDDGMSLDTAYKDFLPPIVPRYHVSHMQDDISETTFSMTINDMADDRNYPCNGGGYTCIMMDHPYHHDHMTGGDMDHGCIVHGAGTPTDSRHDSSSIITDHHMLLSDRAQIIMDQSNIDSHNHHHINGHFVHPYDRPPPPTPVTECSVPVN